MINLVLNGGNGKIGKELQAIIKDKYIDKLNLTAIIVGNEDLGQVDNQLIFQDLKNIQQPIDLIIDFSSIEGLKSIINFLKTKTKISLVSGTTGIDENIKNDLLNLSRNHKIFWSSNMSPGINLILKMITKFGKNLSNYDCEIIEKHHNAKLDSPSGTALMLVNEILESRNQSFDVVKYGRHGNQKRLQNEICIHAVRGGSIFGEHEINFINQSENITISHTAYNRKIFAEAAIKCGVALVNQSQNGMFNFNELFYE